MCTGFVVGNPEVVSHSIRRLVVGSRLMGSDRDCSRLTLVLYRKRTAPQFQLASTSEVRFRYSRQKEAARGCGGRGVLWEFNRFLPEKPCQTGTLAKILLLMLIDIELLATICVILPPAPSVLQEVSSDACVYTRVASAAERLRSDGQAGSYRPRHICLPMISEVPGDEISSQRRFALRCGRTRSGTSASSSCCD
jgi:hypothetical protein